MSVTGARWSAEERQALAAGVRAGQSSQALARQFGRSPVAIEHMVTKLRREGVLPCHTVPVPAQRRQFSAAERAAILRRREAGDSPRAIAADYGCSRGEIVAVMISIGMATRVAGDDTGGTSRAMTARRCLCCRDGFLSEGAHNRLCERCRQLADGLPDGALITTAGAVDPGLW